MRSLLRRWVARGITSSGGQYSGDKEEREQGREFTAEEQRLKEASWSLTMLSVDSPDLDVVAVTGGSEDSSEEPERMTLVSEIPEVWAWHSPSISRFDSSEKYSASPIVASDDGFHKWSVRGHHLLTRPSD
jgi:hypothetical protein